MNSTREQALVGIFVLVAAALLIGTLLAVSGAFSSGGVPHHTYFKSAGGLVPAATAGAPPHDWLKITGGAIGWGLPAAVGAAVAVPDRKVVALQADGSAMYTIQSLWTAARERLDITVVIFNNRSYGILRGELARLGVPSGQQAHDMLDLSRPDINFVSLAEGLGVQAERATTAEQFIGALRRGLDDPGPRLIDAVL